MTLINLNHNQKNPVFTRNSVTRTLLSPDLSLDNCTYLHQIQQEYM